MEVFIGCSGYFYWHWKGRFYPAELTPKEWLSYYQQRFSALEVNATFYRYPTPSTLKRWRREGKNLYFVFKVPQEITHRKKLKDIRDKIVSFYEMVEEIFGSRLLAILFQLPPSFRYTQETLQRVLTLPTPREKTAVEFRHPSFWEPQAIEALRQERISMVSVSGKNLPDTVLQTGPMVYVRFHGIRGHGDNYPHKVLQRYAEEVNRLSPSRALFFFNNDVNAYAPKNALELKRIWENLVK